MARSASSDSLRATATRAYSGDVSAASTSPKRRYAGASVRAVRTGTALPAVRPGIPAILARRNNRLPGALAPRRPSGRRVYAAGVDAGDWRWDETLYAGSAAYYLVGRLPYPKAVAEALAHELGLDRTQRLLDVGCGPGSLTLVVAPWVSLAVGVDADREMIA